MFQIEQSTFLHALGYAIGHSLWQMSLLWLVYFASIHLKKWSSSRKYILAVTASLAGLVGFICTFTYYANHLQIDSQESTAFSMIKSMPAAVSNSANFLFIYNSSLATLKSLSPYLSCAYLVVMLVLSIRLANGFGQVKQLRTQGLSKPSIDWRLFVKEHARFLGIEKSVQLYISTVASSPLTIGFWKPIILIPIASINQLSTQQMEAVLLHELAHIKRHDYLLNIILQLAEIALFFNPFMRLLLKQARQERENSCDDWVLQFRYNAADYARALLAIEQQSVQSLLALGTNNNNEFQLLNRVKRMLAPERQSFNYRQQLGLLFLITIIGLGFTVIAPRQKTKQEPLGQVVKNEAQVVVETAAPKPAPMLVDLVKNLENIQKISRIVATPEFKKKTEEMATQAQGMAEQILADDAMHKQAAEWEAKAKAINLSLEKLPIKEWAALGDEEAKKYAMHFAQSNFDPKWFNKANLLLAESAEKNAQAGMLNFESINPMVWNFEPGTLPSENANAGEAQKFKVKKEREKQVIAERENLRIGKLNKAYKLLSDSLIIVKEQMDEKVVVYRGAVARARKEAAIAPFRTTDPVHPRTPPAFNLNYTYNYSTGTEIDEHDVVSIGESNRNVRVYARKNTDRNNDPCNCTCKPTPAVQGKNKTVITINGKAFTENVKKMLLNARQELSEEWSAELQQQVEEELKKELKDLEKLNIKTRVIQGSGDNNKAFVIEIETKG